GQLGRPPAGHRTAGAADGRGWASRQTGRALSDGQRTTTCRPRPAAAREGLLIQDPAKAREIARQTMAFYMPLPNYRNNWLRLGFREEDLADGGSNRFLDAMVAWGGK